MRFGWLGLALAAGTFMAVPLLHAQAPAGAPAGSNGICKDGTYSTAAKKDGACRGHKGVQTWYLASTASSAPMPSAGTSAPAMPVPSQSTSAPAMPVPTPATSPAPAVSSTPRRSPSASLASKTQAPGGGPGMVWVNTSTNVYHCNGDDVYGKTKAGSYMSEADAKAKGARAARGQACTGK